MNYHGIGDLIPKPWRGPVSDLRSKGAVLGMIGTGYDVDLASGRQLIEEFDESVSSVLENLHQRLRQILCEHSSHVWPRINQVDDECDGEIRQYCSEYLGHVINLC